MKCSSASIMLLEIIRASAASSTPTRRSATSDALVSGFNSAMVLGISSVRISPSVSAWRADGALNRFRAASASSMMRRATEWNCSADRGRRDALLVPDEQRRTKFCFKVGNGRRDRGLRDEAAPGCRCQVALPKDGREISKLPNIHSPNLLMISDINIVPMAGRMASKRRFHERACHADPSSQHRHHVPDRRTFREWHRRHLPESADGLSLSAGRDQRRSCTCRYRHRARRYRAAVDGLGANGSGRPRLGSTRPRRQSSRSRLWVIQPGDVRHVLLTHLDRDHAGGIPDFPKARVHVHRKEHEMAVAA